MDERIKSISNWINTCKFSTKFFEPSHLSAINNDNKKLYIQNLSWKERAPKLLNFKHVIIHATDNSRIWEEEWNRTKGKPKTGFEQQNSLTEPTINFYIQMKKVVTKNKIFANARITTILHNVYLFRRKKKTRLFIAV